MGDLRDRIFEMYVLRRYEREQRKVSSEISFTLDEIYEVLGYASMERILTFLGDTSLINAEMLRDGKVIEPGANLEAFVRQVELLSLVSRYDAENIRFMHLLMRDYFGYRYASQLLLSEDKEARKRAILALTELRDPRSKDIVVQALSEFEDYPNVVWRCIQALGEIGDATVAAGLAPFVHDNEPDIRIAAAATLRQLGDHLAIIPLLELAEDRSQFIKKFVADEVRQIRDVRAIDGLILGLSNNNLMIARAAHDAFIHIGADAVIPLLKVLEHSTVNTVRQLAIEALGEIADHRATQALIAALRDDSQVNLMQRICDIAADALGKIGTDEAVGAVEEWRRQ
jgi:HEAT repeat protein